LIVGGGKGGSILCGSKICGSKACSDERKPCSASSLTPHYKSSTINKFLLRSIGINKDERTLLYLNSNLKHYYITPPIDTSLQESYHYQPWLHSR
jgi:hypothetical protein